MKGILLAGGLGTRLGPLTKSGSKHLLGIYDKPLIYYSLTTLILSGVEDIAVIVSEDTSAAFYNLLGDGSKLGLEISYVIQKHPRGIPEALILCEDFVKGHSVVLALGDNIFHGPGLGRQLSMPIGKGAKVFGFKVSDPSAYGVAVLDEDGVPRKLVEKPITFLSDIAIPGLYFLDETASKRSASLSPSRRGELEIIDLLEDYMKESQLGLDLLPRGTVWLDAGTPDSMSEASEYVRVMQNRQGYLIGSPEEASWRLGRINDTDLEKLAEEQRNSTYGKMLLELLRDKE